MLPCLVRGLFLRSAAAPSGPNKHLTHTRIRHPLGPPTPNLAEGSGAIVYTSCSPSVAIPPPPPTSSLSPSGEALNHPWPPSVRRQFIVFHLRAPLNRSLFLALAASRWLSWPGDSRTCYTIFLFKNSKVPQTTYPIFLTFPIIPPPFRRPRSNTVRKAKILLFVRATLESVEFVKMDSRGQHFRQIFPCEFTRDLPMNQAAEKYEASITFPGKRGCLFNRYRAST